MVACPGGVQVQGEVRSLAISSIRTDGRTQQRHTLDPSVVSRYAEMMGEGVVFPPVRVWWDSAEYWLSDGFHRLAAAIEAHRTHFDADIRPGSLSDAQWDSFSANSLHGLQLSAQERQEVIQRALQHPKAANLSNVELAKQLHVSEKTIRRRRKPAGDQGRRNLSNGHRRNRPDGAPQAEKGSTRIAVRTRQHEGAGFAKSSSATDCPWKLGIRIGHNGGVPAGYRARCCRGQGGH